VLGRVGFEEVAIRERFDPFLGTSKERTARKYGVVGVNVFARRPAPTTAHSPTPAFRRPST
jgi:hypothetical protein